MQESLDIKKLYNKENSTSSIFQPVAKNEFGSRSGSLSFFADALTICLKIKPELDKYVLAIIYRGLSVPYKFGTNKD
jgi:hypothetical protein